MKTIILGVFSAILTVPVVTATVRTWNGGGADGNWSTAANWGGSAPVPGDTLDFAGTQRLFTTNDFSGGVAYDSLLFASGAGSFALSGSSIAIAGGITNSSANTPSINLDVELNGIVPINTSAGSIDMRGVLSGEGFTVSGGKYLRLYGANTFTGVVTVAAGDLSVYDEAGLGTTAGTTHAADGAQLRFYGTNTVDETIYITGDVSIGYDGALRVDQGLTEFRGPIISQSSRIKTASGQTAVVSGGITGNSIVLGADSNSTIIITNNPIVVDSGAREHFHSAGNIVLAATNNIWGGLQIAQCKFRTDLPDVFPAGKYLEMGVSYSPSSYFNMNGNDQSIGTLLHNGLNASNVGECRLWSDDPATLTVNQGSDQTVYVKIEGAVSLVKTGSARLTLGLASCTTTGRTVVTAGRLGIADEGSLGVNPGVPVADQLEIDGGTLAVTSDVVIDDSNRGVTLGAAGGTFEASAGSTLTIGNQVTGSGALAKAGSGDLVLAQANAYQGRTDVRGGHLIVTSEDQLGAAPASLSGDHLLLSGGRLRASGTFTIDDANRGIAIQSGTWGGFTVDGGETLTVNNVISGDGSFIKQGDGTLILGAANTFTARFNIEGGVVEVDSEEQLGANPAAYMQEKLTLHGGTLKTTASFVVDDSNRGVRIAENGGVFDVAAGTTLIISNIVDGSGNLVKTGDGTLVLAAANIMTGTIRCDAGTLEITNPLGVQNAVLDFSGAGAIIFNVGGGDIEVGGLTGDGDLDIGSGNLIVGNQNLTSAFGGDISGSGGLEKVGSGTFTLSGSNTYDGVTLVSSGRLMIEKRNALYAGNTADWTAANIAVESGATLGYYAGGVGEFTSSDIAILSYMGTVSGGYKAGSSIAFDTSNASGGQFDHDIVIPDPGGNRMGLRKYGEGTLALTADNTYTGPTVMYAGVLSGDNFQDGGTACSIGAAPLTAGNLIFQGGVLQFTGTGTADMNRIITFGSGGGYRARFDVTRATATLVLANLEPSKTLGMQNTGVFEKHGPGKLLVGRNDGATSGGYVCGILAYEIYEGELAAVSGNHIQLNVNSLEAQGPAILLGDGARMSHAAPLNDTSTGTVQVIRYVGTNLTAYSVGHTLCGASNEAGKPWTQGFNWKILEANDGAADVDLEITGNFGIYRWDPANGYYAHSRLVKAGAGTVRLNGNASQYKDTTVVRNGRLLIDENIPYGGNSVLGDCTDDIWICDERTESGDVPFLAFEGGNDRTVARGIQVKAAAGAMPTVGAVSDITVNYNKAFVLSNNLWITSVSSGAKALKFNAPITGFGGIVKSGSGVAELHAANTYTGVTEVAEGTLRFGAAGSIASASALKISGGVLELDGADPSFASLTVAGDGEIDFSDGDSTVTIGDSSGVAWSGSLVIRNWGGSPAGGGADQFFIGSGESLAPEQLAMITTPGGLSARQLASGEVVFIPAGTIIIIR